MTQTRGDEKPEHGLTLMNLIDELSATDRDSVTRRDACRDQHAACIERLGAKRLRLELFGLDVLPDDGLAVGTVDDRLPADDYTGNAVPELRGDRDGLAGRREDGGSAIANCSTVACC
jgi:hypothetical protein